MNLSAQTSMSKKNEQVFAFVFGVVFVIVMLALAIARPNPTPFQYTVFRIVLALAAAGVAAMIPGFIVITLPGWIRAGGALAVFVIVFFYNPAALVVPDPGPDPTASFSIHAACPVGQDTVVDTWSFPLRDIRTHSDVSAFRNLIGQLPDQRCDLGRARIFRIKDERELSPNADIDAIGDGNLGVILLPQNLIVQLGSEHVAFTYVHSQIGQSRKASKAPIERNITPDGRFQYSVAGGNQSGVWDSGKPAPQWVYYTFQGSQRTITRVVFTVGGDANNTSMKHALEVDGQPVPTNEFNGDGTYSAGVDLIYRAATPRKVSALKLTTLQGGNSVGWRNIMIFGYD